MVQNNWLRKVNFVLALVVMLCAFAVKYYQNQNASEITNQNILAENIQEVVDNISVALSEEHEEKVVIPVNVEKLEVNAPLMVATEEKVDIPLMAATEVQDETEEAKIYFEYEGSTLEFNIQLEDCIVIDWGDGKTESIKSGVITHKYAKSGRYEVKIKEDKVYHLNVSDVKGIKNLILNGCNALEYLDCANTEIENLELTNCSKLAYLVCNNTKISELDLSSSSKLGYLYYGEGLKSIKLNEECKSGLKLYGSSETKIEYVKLETLYGDINEDGVLDGRDLLMLARYVGGNTTEVTEQGLKNADVNLDGKVDTIDLLLVTKKNSGEDITFPVETEKSEVRYVKVSEVVKLGDYITYQPTATSYTAPASTTNYSKGQVFNPSEATMWRVLSNDSINGVQLITAGSVGKLTLKGNIGFNNIVKTLNALNKAYEHEIYTTPRTALGATSSSIEVNKSGTYYAQASTTSIHDTYYTSDLELMKNAGVEEIGEAYWLASRQHNRSSSTKYWYGRIITTNGELSGSQLHKASGQYSSSGSTATNGVRPVVKLKDNLVVVGGKGTIEEPYEIAVHEDGSLNYRDIFSNSKTNKGQIAVIRNGEVTETYEYNCEEDDKFEVFALSKTILGILAAKMDQEGIIDLDQTIDKYWYALADLDFGTCSDEWNAYTGGSGARNPKNLKLVGNSATLRNFLTHSSTIKNGYMQWENSEKSRGEYFSGSIGKTFSMAVFMLTHTEGQLFNKGETPGAKTEYNKDKDALTREHALAGFTMQVAVHVSINEYLRDKILNPLEIYTYPEFKRDGQGEFRDIYTGKEKTIKLENGHSMYYAAGYQSSAKDFAKIIALLANDGKYKGIQILDSNAMSEIEKIEANLGNQTIAFNSIDGKLERDGKFGSTTGFYRYGLDQTGWNSYVSYDPNTGDGFVVTAYGENCDRVNLVNEIKNYVYGN